MTYLMTKPWQTNTFFFLLIYNTLNRKRMNSMEIFRFLIGIFLLVYFSVSRSNFCSRFWFDDKQKSKIEKKRRSKSAENAKIFPN